MTDFPLIVGNFIVPLTRHFGAIPDAGENVRFFESGILLEDFAGRHPAGKQVKDKRDPEAMSPNAWFTEADVRVN